MKTDVVVVGAGISGITAARALAESGKRVLVVEKRHHIGGNCYDEYNENGILVHKYGPHIFHTNYRKVWLFLSRFTRWIYYQHKVLSWVNGQFVPFPISPLTLEVLHGKSYSVEDFRRYLESVRLSLDGPPRNSKEVIISQVGEELYRLFFEGYTLKQWGVYPEDLLPEVCARIPVRYSRDQRYFSDTYQGIPTEGYTRMFQRMLEHPNISVLLGTDYIEERKYLKAKVIIYTGSLERYFDSCEGPLPYRKVRFEFETYKRESFQPVAVVNYPNDYDFTRITEYKKLTGQHHPYTTVSFEYPGEEGVECYPFPSLELYERKEKYMALASKEKGVFFLGRLGTYRYINMDQAVMDALTLVERILDS